MIGTKISHFEIVEKVGAGAMGDVYRARDPRIGRDVAIKILPPDFSAKPDRLLRFEHEVRAIGMLNHPNILAVYDVGGCDGSPYIVSELLEGHTLRTHLDDGALPPRRAVDYARQIAQGLAAAHEKGVVHRDLKPGNLFVTTDGRVKILDFGLAKLTRPDEGGGSEDASHRSTDTDPNTVPGTIGYMSPEQVRGQKVDHRSDIFVLGAILYEMLSGRPAFRGESAADTMSAILKEEPAFPETPYATLPAIEPIVRHCLEKSPTDRFQSARDLAFDLAVLGELSGGALARVAPALAPSRRRRVALVAGGLVLLALGAVGVTLLAGRATRTSPPLFRQLTFRRGMVQGARFAPDGQTVIYGAAWAGSPVQLFTTRPETPESRALGLSAGILAVSSSGEMAVLPNCPCPPCFGTLARVSLTGEAPREMLNSVAWADWAPDGQTLAVVRAVSGRQRLEFPVGKVLYESRSGDLSHPRVSPKGDLVAFFDSAGGEGAGTVTVVNRDGKAQILSSGWPHEKSLGLAWSPDGREIWFTTAGQTDPQLPPRPRALNAVTLAGRHRVVARIPGGFTLHDIGRDGRILLTRDSDRLEIVGLPPGETRERDLSWLDGSLARDLSADGRTLLFQEVGEQHGMYVRKTDGSPAVRLGDGAPLVLSPNGRSIIGIRRMAGRGRPGHKQQMVILPTGAGEAQDLNTDPVSAYAGAVRWFSDGRRILFWGAEPGRRPRWYVKDLPGGPPRPVTPEGAIGLCCPNPLSPDGKWVVASLPRSGGVQIWLYPVGEGEERPIPARWSPGGASGVVLGWRSDGRSIYVGEWVQPPAVKVFQVDVATGRKALWKELRPADPAGVTEIESALLTPDGASYVYNYSRRLTDLFLVEGLR